MNCMPIARTMVVTAAGVVALVSCGGGGGDAPAPGPTASTPAPPPVPAPAPTTQVPTSAMNSASGATAFVVATAAAGEASDEVVVGDATLGRNETDEPETI